MNLLIGFLVWIVVAILSGITGHFIGRSRGRGATGFWLGFLLGPLFGWTIALFIREDVEANSKRKCPYCAEIIRSDAKICRFCRKELNNVTTHTDRQSSIPRIDEKTSEEDVEIGKKYGENALEAHRRAEGRDPKTGLPIDSN